jgi:4-amino-4-deoxy-L-arabinose transferase-like glycosyltransferase
MTGLATAQEHPLFRVSLALVIAITAVRIAVLYLTPLELYPDEAQYWWWAQSPDWGYFSKPPLIAWIIRTTTLLGDSEWAIRLASPILHGGTALLLYGIGKQAFDARVGCWSTVAYLLMPGVIYSSLLISTDVPLLFCWAVALYAFLRALDDKRWRWPLLCGAAVGFGLLAKYAMLYFLLGGAVAALFSPRLRALILSGRGAAILVLGFAILSPNLLWNAAHDFPTLRHTEANANWAHSQFSLPNALEFVLGQFGVFGPLMMAGFIAALWRLGRSKDRTEYEMALAAFSAPILALIVAQSFISEANANWAAVAYIAATPLAVAVLLRSLNGVFLWVSIGIGAAAMLCFGAASLQPSLADAVRQGNAFKRMEGWKALGQSVADEAASSRYDAIAAANRSLLAELLYYAQPRSIPIRAWDPNPVPRDHFQMAIPLTAASRHVLFVVASDERHTASRTFDSFVPVRTIHIRLSRGRWRTTSLYDAQGYRGARFPQ